MSDQLNTARLTLRPLHLGDAPALYRVFCDPVAMRYFGNTHSDLARTEDWLNATLSEPHETTQEFAILLGGQVIGKAGVWAAPELGFFLHRAHWGQGLMYEALQTLLPHLFLTMSLAKITADVDPRNQACLRLLHRLGFAETGRAENTIEIAGHWCDSIYLSCPSARH